MHSPSGMARSGNESVKRVSPAASIRAARSRGRSAFTRASAASRSARRSGMRHREAELHVRPEGLAPPIAGHELRAISFLPLPELFRRPSLELGQLLG